MCHDEGGVGYLSKYASVLQKKTSLGLNCYSLEMSFLTVHSTYRIRPGMPSHSLTPAPAVSCPACYIEQLRVHR